eukprot:EG_transcript_392
MLVHRKHAVYEPGVVCFCEDQADSWRIGCITAVAPHPAHGAPRQVTLVACDDEGQPCQPPEVFTVPLSQLAPLEQEWLTPMRDLLEMPVLLDSLLLEHVRRRYWQDVMYTNIGPIVLSLNPFNFNLPLYSDDRMPLYIEERQDVLQGGSKHPTHAWSVAHQAYWMMLESRRPQSILVSGESGAGKTEAAKMVLRYLATCSTYFAHDREKTKARHLTDKIQRASPILEAFGNAKTKRNDNSSRFGKYMKLQFNSQGYLHGAYTINYLLERSRVVGHASGERSYHTFYQLAAAAEISDELQRRYRLDDPDRFAWIYAGVPRNDKDLTDDAAEFWRVQEAFSVVGFRREEVDAIYGIVAGIMHLQALRWLPSRDTATLPDVERAWLRFVARLWEVDAEELYKELTTTTNQVKGDTFTIQHTLAQVYEVRDALSKAVYERTFQYIVDRLNEVLDRQRDTEEHSWIGLLDIFGFEEFETNYFEQLCINFANEQLQHHYNTCVFQRDMEQYKAERINCSYVEHPDNKPTLDLIRGLFQLLNDQSRAGSDANFIDNIYNIHGRHKSFRKPRIGKSTFGVAHYSGEVWYTANGMREKNVDPLKPALRKLLSASRNPLTAALLTAPQEGEQQRLGMATVAKFFQSSLQDLVQMIDLTNPHWIRCIKPHSSNRPRMFWGSEVMSQLRCAGVLETIRIRQMGYPMRLPFAEFWLRFRLLGVQTVANRSFMATPRGSATLAELIRDLIQALELKEEECQMGLTKVFLKDCAYRRLEALRNLKLDHLALVAQRFVLQKEAFKRRHAHFLQQQCVALQAFGRAWGAQYERRCREKQRHDRRVTAALETQRLARVMLACRLTWRLRMLHYAARVQAAARAVTSQRRVLVFRGAAAEKRAQAIDLLRTCTRAHLSELVARERQGDVVAWLEAELEVLAEARAAKRREEAARKEALKALIRSQAAAGDTPADGDDVFVRAMQELADNKRLIEQQKSRIAELEEELNLTRQCSRALGEEFAEAEAAAAQLEAQRRRAEDREHKLAAQLRALEEELRALSHRLQQERSDRLVQEQEVQRLRAALARTADGSPAKPARQAAAKGLPAEHYGQIYALEKQLRTQDTEIGALKGEVVRWREAQELQSTHLEEAQQQRQQLEAELEGLTETLRQERFLRAAAQEALQAAQAELSRAAEEGREVRRAEETRAAALERQLRARDADVGALKVELLRTQQQGDARAAGLEHLCWEAEAIVSLLDERDKDFGDYRARHHAWGVELTAAIHVVESLLNPSGGSSTPTAHGPSRPPTDPEGASSAVAALKRLQQEGSELARVGEALTDFGVLAQQLQAAIPGQSGKKRAAPLPLNRVTSTIAGGDEENPNSDPAVGRPLDEVANDLLSHFGTSSKPALKSDRSIGSPKKGPRTKASLAFKKGRDKLTSAASDPDSQPSRRARSLAGSEPDRHPGRRDRGTMGAALYAQWQRGSFAEKAPVLALCAASLTASLVIGLTLGRKH